MPTQQLLCFSLLETIVVTEVSSENSCPAVACVLCVGATEPRALFRPEQPDEAAGHLPTVD